MARSVDAVNYGALVDMGNTRPVPNLELTVEITFTRNDGTRVTETRTPNFPNYVLNRMPANIFKKRVTDMMIECMRVQVGAVDNWGPGSDPLNILGTPIQV
jgi:hypothetical protein